MKRSQVRWLGHLLTKGGTSILPQGKIGVGRPRLCQQRLDLTCPDVIASIKDRNRWNHLSVSRKANENKNVCLSFSYLILLFTCQSICQLFNYIMKKMQTNIFINFSFSLNRIFCMFTFISKQWISIFTLIYFEFRLESTGQKLKKKFIFSYREITDKWNAVCFTHTLLCDDNEILARFFNW